MEKYDYVPEELKALIRWICYKLVPGKDKNGNPKIDKVPKNPHNGYTASSTDPDVWSDFNTAVAAVEKYNLDGIGFQFQDSGYIGVDIDHCINGDGMLSEMSKDVVTTLNSYTEISPSGTGLHIIMKGKKPGEKCVSKSDPVTREHLEMFDSGKYFTVTGNLYQKQIRSFLQIREDAEAINKVYYRYLEKEKERKQTAILHIVPCNMSDYEVIDRIRQSSQAYKFSQLFDAGDISKYGNDNSDADMALMVILAFWTQKNQAQMERIFSMSALAQNGTWQQKTDHYRKRTIQKACEKQQTVYDPDYYDSQAYNDSVVYSFDDPIDLSGGEASSKEVALTDPSPVPAETDGTLDPGEWQREDFRNREKLNMLFNHIYLHKDSFLLEVFKDRARELKVIGMAKLWTEYEKARDKQINASEIAKKKSKLIPLVEAGSLRTGAYTISAKGIIKEVEKKEEIIIIDVISVPVLPVSILTNVETGTVRTRLWWKHENRPAHEEIVENRILADRSKILMLASRGLPVDSTNALDVVEYLSVIAAKNDDIIPHDESVSSLGWHNNNEKFSPYDTELIIDNITENITIFQSIKSKGTLEEWTAFMAPHMEDKRFHIVMAASFGSVILRLVGALPFILHFWGKTGTGKSVTLMAASSIWGNPAPGAYLRSMDATTNAVMRIAGFLRNLPVIADEMQTVRDKEGNYDKFIMRVSEGVERSRLNSDSSLRPLQEWNCIFICSGEEPIVSIRSGAGAVNRVIEVELEASEPLFPGSLGNEVANFCRDHYGTAGPEFVNHIKALEPDTLRTMYNDCCKTLTAEKLSAKQALSAAAILTASQIISTLIFCDKVEPLHPDDIIPYLKTELTVDPAERAYTALMNVFAANQNRFISKKDTGTMLYEYEPAQGEIWGKAVDGGYSVNKSILERELQNAGFQFNAVKKAWAEKGYLLRNSQGGYFHQRNEHGTRCEYIQMMNPTEKT